MKKYIKPKLTKHGQLKNVTFSREDDTPTAEERAKWKAEINRIKGLE